ncbi:DEAD/DEAH box helicase domain protein [Methylocella silvestris BL2]|uniref:DEAD/DEAH box helicase domain protein n=1 Tax=Methylocella silvestris (strain DSM 15510 / CIP 108128 / LMG 27833 / NCIMB 13906 / BL2) TaxID=395965 RepID=B8ENW6_METSB|nr:DEAD/DEAH box helicase domain protein [Methylocella silvestris BL2]
MPFQSSNPALARALAERNYDQATDVQTAALEPAAAGRDLLVSAQTGSGKTVAYGLAIAEDLFAGAPALGAAGEPLALIITPTRELALQVQRELEWLYHYAGARVISCVGGMEPRRERRDLAAGAHIVVGTPGRLRDHIERGALIVSRLKAVVLDEADEMLDLGFREDLEFILETTPPERRTLLFSATLPKGIATLAKRFQKNALRIEVAGKERGHADIEYRAMRVAPNEIEHAVVNVLRMIDPPGAIVFCNTREAVRHLHAFLVERGFSAALLSGELSQNERNHALQALRDGRARVCVATDVAARGIDLPGLALVIHADLPHDAEILQHRSGRTGRAGRKGISIILVPSARKRRAERLLMEAGLQPSWSGPPTAEEIRRLDHERLLRDPLLDEPIGEEDSEIARALLDERSPEAIAAALARLLRARLPAAEEVQDPGEGARNRPLRDGAPQRATARGRRRRLVQARHRLAEKGRSEMAAAHAVPSWRCDQAGHRRDPNFRTGNLV